MQLLDNARAALLGDALGATLEFSRRDSRPHHTEITGGGPFQLSPGDWTDDTSMALALADSLLHAPGFDPAVLMTRFVAWYRDGAYSCTGSCFDVGTVSCHDLHPSKTWPSGQSALLNPSTPRGPLHGYVIYSLEVALWAVGTMTTFEEVLILAVNLGDDADMVGAVTGQLAGALYGASAIPNRWLHHLAWRGRITDLANHLIAAGSPQPVQR